MLGNSKSVAMYFTRAESAAEGLCVTRDGGGLISIKLMTLIDELVSGFVESIAGAGKTSKSNKSEDTSARDDGSNGRQRMTSEDVVASIHSHEGWEFAFEGGAHILFRHTTTDRRFVPPSRSSFFCFCRGCADRVGVEG